MFNARTHIITLAFLFLGAAMVCAQEVNEDKTFGKEAFDNYDYYSAAYYFTKVVGSDSTDLEAAYMLADASRLSLAYKDAEKWYEYVKRTNVIDTDFPLLTFHLGSVKKSLGKYNEALALYELFVSQNKEKQLPQMPKALQEIASCKTAPFLLKDTTDVNISRLTETINTPYSEFNPYPLGDSVLYFSSLRPTSKETPDPLIPVSYATAVYKSTSNLNGWKAPLPVDFKVNKKNTHIANITLNEDHSKAIFSCCTEESYSKLSCKLYQSYFKGDRWTPAEKLTQINKNGYTFTQPAYATHESQSDVLFFVSDRPGGQGGLDLWYSVFKENKYNEPINLGSFVNTPGDEISPFYNAKEQKLYYSSDWTEGLGGYDIFYTKGYMNDWGKPVNLGYPINTSFNDIYYVMNPDYPEAYLTSNRPGSLHLKGETCCNDIYFAKFKNVPDTTPVVKISDSIPQTRKSQIDELLPLTLYFHNDEPDPGTTKTQTDISYQKTLEAYVALIDTYKNEYSKGLTGSDKEKAKLDIEDFFNLYVYNGLEKLKKFALWLTEDLEAGNTVQITVRGYCSPLNRGSYNVNLSKRRISSLLNFIKTWDNGILLPYIEKRAPNGGRLDIFEEPLGDEQAAPFVSNNPNDVRNSVYSRVAALERKVEIVMYNSGADSTQLLYPEISFRQMQQDFGTLKKGEMKTHIFIFKNTGKSPLLLTSAETSSASVVTDWEVKEIPPMGTGVVNILLNTKDLQGDVHEYIYVTGNSNQGKIILEVKAKISD